jgi:hypothetical protein
MLMPLVHRAINIQAVPITFCAVDARRKGRNAQAEAPSWLAGGLQGEAG